MLLTSIQPKTSLVVCRLVILPEIVTQPMANARSGLWATIQSKRCTSSFQLESGRTQLTLWLMGTLLTQDAIASLLCSRARFIAALTPPEFATALERSESRENVKRLTVAWQFASQSAPTG